MYCYRYTEAHKIMIVVTSSQPQQPEFQLFESNNLCMAIGIICVWAIIHEYFDDVDERMFMKYHIVYSFVGAFCLCNKNKNTIHL